MQNLPNIDFKKTAQNPTIDSDTSLYTLPFYKDTEYFSNLDNFVVRAVGFCTFRAKNREDSLNTVRSVLPLAAKICIS